jgi:hypothetical protein
LWAGLTSLLVDLDQQFMALVKQHPQLVLGPNMPDRGVAANIEWLRSTLPAEPPWIGPRNR